MHSHCSNKIICSFKKIQKIVNFLFSDKLGSTVFAPVKMDFVGNIKVL